MTESRQGENAAAEKQDRPDPKWNLERLRVAVASQIGGTFKWCAAWARQLGRWITDGLNYASPALTTLATCGIVWLAYLQWQALHNTDDKIGQQVRITDNQLRLMYQQLSEIQISGLHSERNIAATEELARATNILAQIAQKNDGRQLRAKISIPTVEIENFEIGGVLNAIIQVENTGQGTAKVRLRGIVRVASNSDTNFAIDRKTLVAGLTVHGSSKLPRQIRANFRLSDDQFQSVNAARSAIIIFGDYQVTDEAKIVKTCTYRLYYRGSGVPPNVGGPWMPAPGMSNSKPPVLRQTAAHNECGEEKPAK